MAKRGASESIQSLRKNPEKNTLPQSKPPAVERGGGGAMDPPEANSRPATATKISISVYPQDIVRMDVIKDFMREQGIRNLSDSEALRIACRALTLGLHCVDVYRFMQKEDGRRKEKVAS